MSTVGAVVAEDIYSAIGLVWDDWGDLPADPSERVEAINRFLATPPASHAAGLDERDRLVQEVQWVMFSLSDSLFQRNNNLSDIEYEEWRRRAKLAQRFKQQRLAFLKRWLFENRPKVEKVEPPAGVVGVGKMVGLLESVYVTALQWRDAPSDDTLAALAAQVDHVRSRLGGEA